MTATYGVLQRKRQFVNARRWDLAAKVEHQVMRVRNQFLPHYFGPVPRWRLMIRSLGGERVLPDFACVSAHKCGTSDLCAYLLQHPCILPPLSKEIPSVVPETWRRYYPTVREKERAEKAYGKVVSGYFYPALHILTLMDNYRAVRPDAKIVILLRNPMDRAYSQYKSDLFYGSRRVRAIPYYRSFGDYVNLALDLFPATPAPTASAGAMLQSGIYVKSVQLWMERFGADNLLIMRSEDFFKDTAGSLCRIHEFLGLPALAPELHGVVHRNPIEAPPFDDETRQRLRDFYAPWNEKLYAVIGRDMAWN